MDRKPISLNIDNFKNKESSLYYKKIICRKNKLKNKANNSFSTNKMQTSFIESKKINLSFMNKKQNPIKKNKLPIIKKTHKRTCSTLNITLNPNIKLYKKIKVPYINLNIIILIQKTLRGFLTRKKMKNLKLQKNNIYLTKTANPKRFKNRLNMNILNEIKKNSKKRKESIQKLNNRYNNTSYTYNTKTDKKIPYKKNIIYINKDIGMNRKYSFDYNKNKNKNNNNNINNTNNKNGLIDNNKSSYISRDLKCNTLKKNEYQNSVPEIDFSMSNFVSEQYPQNINISNDNPNNNDNNLNNKILDNKNMCQTDGNIFKKYNNNNNDVNKSNIISNKNKKNLVLPEIKMPSHLSSYQTKENTSFERYFTTENNIIFNLDSPHNKNGQKTDRDTQNNINNTNSKILESKKKEKKLKNGDDNIDLSIDNYLKDEFDSDANYEKNKKSLNMINTNIKYNFNPLVNSKIKLKNINNTKTNNNKTNNNKNKLRNQIFPNIIKILI